MFTGIVEAIGGIVSINKRMDTTVLCVNCSALYSKEVKIDIGDSISINGVCLTVVKIQRPNLYFDVSGETLKSTNIDGLSAASKVNLEPAMSANGRFGGHIVSGHVDGIGTISSINNTGNGVIITINTPKDILRYIIKKGSITVDGVGLTVVDVLFHGFTVVIIPHTSMNTTLGFKKVGDIVNLEGDILGKYVEKFVTNFLDNDNASSDAGSLNGSKTLMNKLIERGFIK